MRNQFGRLFVVGGRRDGRSYVGTPFGDVDDLDDAEDPADFDLDFLTKKGMKFSYIYDMGDSWDHTIVVENADYDHHGDEPPVFVLAGKRNCPPEDCGGSWGYTELVEALADKKHPQHGEGEHLPFGGGNTGTNFLELHGVNCFVSSIYAYKNR